MKYVRCIDGVTIDAIQVTWGNLLGMAAFLFYGEARVLWVVEAPDDIRLVLSYKDNTSVSASQFDYMCKDKDTGKIFVLTEKEFIGTFKYY